MDENALSHGVIGAAIEVHRVLGAGLLEFIYEEALVLELREQGFDVLRQTEVDVFYKNQRLENKLRLDIMVNNLVIVEVKAVEHIVPVHEAQLLSYLRLSARSWGCSSTSIQQCFATPFGESSTICDRLSLRPLRSLRLCVEI